MDGTNKAKIRIKGTKANIKKLGQAYKARRQREEKVKYKRVKNIDKISYNNTIFLCNDRKRYYKASSTTQE